MTHQVRKIVLLLATVLALLSLVVAGASAQTVPWREPLEPVRDSTEITVGEDSLTVELSISGAQQSLGLGYRNGLSEGTGMLFVNDEAAPRTFWMKGMRFCIDIIWIEDGVITGAAESVCPDPDGTDDADRARFPSDVPVTYILEVPAGWLDAHGYGVGTPVDIPDEVQGSPGS